MITALRAGLNPRASLTTKGTLIGRLKAASLLSLPEREFAKLIVQIESEPLFQKLFFPGKSLPRVIRRQPWPGMRLAKGFYEAGQVAQATDGVNVEAFIAKHRDLIGLIKKMGQESFERCFLYGDDVRSFDDIVKISGLCLEEVRKVHEMILELSVEGEFCRGRASWDAGTRLRYTLIARLELDLAAPGGVTVALVSPHLARGRYAVNHDALDFWEKQGTLIPEEKKRLRKLLQQIEMINIRQNTILRILEIIVERQADFLVTQKDFLRRSLSMRRLARQLKLAPSTISRAVCGRSVVLPWGEEAPAARLLCGNRQVLESVLKELSRVPENRRLSDRVVGERTRRDFNLAVSRRTINEIRRKIKMAEPSLGMEPAV
ncbi:MAG: hypothetical protein AAB091_00785 [Elusimicrobiota bacterium]